MLYFVLIRKIHFMKLRHQKSKKILKVNHRKSLREQMVSAGAYDGRFRERVVQSKKHKKTKHKKKIFDND